MVNNIDISAWIEKITWSGDSSQIARKINFSYGYSRADSNVAKLAIDNGNTVCAYDGSTLLFTGVVTSMSRQEAGTTYSVNVIDLSWYLGKIKLYGVYAGNAAEITKQVCAEYGIKTSTLLATRSALEVISTGDKTIYQVINEVYAGEAYQMYMDGACLSIKAAGIEVVAILSANTDITDASYTSSIESMINKVVVLDQNNVITDEVQNKQFIGKYGLMQDVYKMEDSKDYKEEAKKRLKGVAESGSISAIGNLMCITGKAIHIMDVSTQITGLFRITADAHTFSSGEHVMSLTLEFKEVV